MKVSLRIVLLTALSVLAVVAAPREIPIAGAVLESGTNQPVPYAKLSFPSGKPIGDADGSGRFELFVNQRNASVVVSRPGYASERIELADYGDLFSIVIYLEPNVRELTASTVRERARPTLNTRRKMPVEMLEDAAGMRFDLTDHLAQLPGFSGQKDFSSELSYNGSRSEDVAYYLDRVRVPNMRHLDIGFPGNLSVINPHVLDAVQVWDNPAEGPVDQGLAAGVGFEPWSGNPERMQARVSAGLVNRELMLAGPFFIGNSFVLSGRFLDSETLKNLGEKFFTEFDRNEECVDCEITSAKDSYNLTSGDIYAHISGGEKGAAWGMTGLWSLDEYEVRQDTSSRIDTVNNTAISQGSQLWNVVTWHYQTAEGTDFSAGWIREVLTDSIRDTTGFRQTNEEAFNNYIGGDRQENNTYRAAWDYLTNTSILGADLSLAVEHSYFDFNRFYPDRNRNNQVTETANMTQGAVRLLWEESSWRLGTAAGVAADYEEYKPHVAANLETKISAVEGMRLFTGAALRQQYNIEPEGYGNLAGEFGQAWTAKLGTGLERSGLQMSLQGYGSWYPDPQLPEPRAFWFYRDQAKAENAWVSGVSFSSQYRTLHHLALGINASSVYGEYEMGGGRSMPWNANRDVDLSANLRYYPLSDSLISMIVTYRISRGQPLYSHHIRLSDRDSEGEWIDGRREVFYNGIEADLYRTDVRFNVDLTQKWNSLALLRLNNLRFFVEVDNIFANAGDWARFLGGDNHRQRSWVTQDNDENPYNGLDLVPWMAKGMGLFVLFGIEANFGG